MEYDSLKTHLAFASYNPESGERVDEVVMTLIAASILAFACAPLLNTALAKGIGAGVGAGAGAASTGLAAAFAGISSLFGGKKKDDDKKDDDKDDDKKDDDKDDDNSTFTGTMQATLGAAGQALNKTPAGEEKDNLMTHLEVMRAVSVDKNGKPIKPEDIDARFKEVTGMSKDEWANASGMKPEDIKADQLKKISEAIEKDLGNKSEEERQKAVEEGLASAKKASEACVKRFEEFKAAQKEVDELNEQIEKAKKEGKDDEVKSLTAKMEEQKKKAEELKKKTVPATKDARDEEETYEVEHDGQKTKIIKRRAKIGDGYVYCYANDRDKTITPDEAEEMIKKGKKVGSGGGSGGPDPGKPVQDSLNRSARPIGLSLRGYLRSLI